MRTAEEALKWMDGQIQVGEEFLDGFLKDNIESAEDSDTLQGWMLLQMSIVGRIETLKQLTRYINGEED